MDEAKNQINDLEHKEEKDNHSEQEEEKRIQKKEDNINKQPLGQLQEVQHLHHRGARRRKESKKLGVYLKN